MAAIDDAQQKGNRARIEAAKKKIIGQRFDRLLVTGYVAGINKPRQIQPRAVCKCDCGNIKIVQIGDLRSNKVKSCGCLKLEKHTERLTKHDMVYTVEYQTWCGIKQRCLYQNAISYKNYGGRGITICASWLDKEYGFLNFFRDMGKKPSDKHSIDRVNNDGNYEPSNCRWATRAEQRINQRPRCSKIQRDSNGRFKKEII